MDNTKQISMINSYLNCKAVSSSQPIRGKLKRRKTDCQYKNELKEYNPTVEVLESYIDARTPILHKCIKHNIEWKIRPNDALKGKGCPQCKKEKISQSRKKTTEWYISELKRKDVPAIPLEDYKDISTPIRHQCLIDDSIFDGIPNYLLSRKTGCYICSQRKRRSHEQYEAELEETMPFIHSLETFNGMNTPILHHCDLHNITWEAVPGNILYQKCGCPECGKAKIGDKNRRTHEEYVEQLLEVNPDIIVIEKYVDSFTSITHLCKKCQYKWKARPANILFGKGCPICCKSVGERKIRQWLDEHKIRYEYQKIFNDCRDKRPLPFDFYLPDYNKCVEYDGEQHFEPIEHFGGEEEFEIRINHDQIKTQYCSDNNISLLRIPYYKDVITELNNFLFI